MKIVFVWTARVKNLNFYQNITKNNFSAFQLEFQNKMSTME